MFELTAVVGALDGDAQHVSQHFGEGLFDVVQMTRVANPVDLEELEPDRRLGNRRDTDGLVAPGARRGGHVRAQRVEATAARHRSRRDHPRRAREGS
jgi:hypothetical protein